MARLSPEEEAAMELRQVIKCLSSATPEDFDLHSAQVELALEEKREAMGSHAARMEWEAKDSLRQARTRLRQEAVDAVRQAAIRLTTIADAASFAALREELVAKQSRMSEWLGSYAEAVGEEVRHAIHAAQVRVEQLAAAEVRRRIQAVSVALPETFDTLREEVDKAFTEFAGNLGAEGEKLREEAKKGLEAGQRNARAVADRRAQQERAAAEAAQRTAEFGAEVARAEAEATSAIQSVATATEQEDLLSPEEALQAGKLCEEAILAVRESVQTAQENGARLMAEAASECLTMGEEPPPQSEIQVIVRALLGRLSSIGPTLDAAVDRAKAARERASRKATAARKEREQRELFQRYATDGDSIRRTDIEALAKEEYELDLKDEFFDKVKMALQTECVVYESFPRLRQMLAIERSEVRARQKRAEEEERLRREKEEEERRQKDIVDRTARATKLLREGDDVLPDASAELARVEVASADILVERDSLSSAQLTEAAASTELKMASPTKELALVRSKLEAAIQTLGDDLAGRLDGEIADLRVRLERAEARAQRLRLAIAKARERSKDAAEKEERLSKQREKFAKLQRAYEEQEEEDEDSDGGWQS